MIEVSPNTFLTVDRDVVKRKIVDPPKDAVAAPTKGA